MVKVAESVLENAHPRHRIKEPSSPAISKLSAEESFLDEETWKRLVKIGNWIRDEDKGRILGASPFTYLLSRGEFGKSPFKINATIRFSNFDKPGEGRFGMNAGIVVGWQSEAGVHRYTNVQLSGSTILIERIGFRGGPEGRDYEHVTKPTELSISSQTDYVFEIIVKSQRIGITVNGANILSANHQGGILGRVGVRPWRSQMEITDFRVAALD